MREIRILSWNYVHVILLAYCSSEMLFKFKTTLFFLHRKVKPPNFIYSGVPSDVVYDQHNVTPIKATANENRWKHVLMQDSGLTHVKRTQTSYEENEIC